MTDVEIETYNMATQSSTQSVSAKNGGVAYIKANMNNFGRHIVTIEADSFANIVDGRNSSDFIVKAKGVHFIDGGPGDDRIVLPGASDNYLVKKVGESSTVVFDTRGDQNLTLHLDHIEQIDFSSDR